MDITSFACITVAMIAVISVVLWGFLLGRPAVERAEPLGQPEIEEARPFEQLEIEEVKQKEEKISTLNSKSPSESTGRPEQKTETGRGKDTPLASKVQELLKLKNVDRLRELTRSESNTIADVLIPALTDNPDPQVQIMAVDALGLTSDPRAVRVLMDVFQNSTGHFRETAARSLANIVANRVKSPEAISSLMLIVKDKSIKTMIRGQAVIALCHFRKDHDEVKQFLTEVANDPNEATEIKFATF